MPRKKKQNSIFVIPILVVIIIIVFVSFSILPDMKTAIYGEGGEAVENNTKEDEVVEKIEKAKIAAQHIKTPGQVKAIYMTACVAGTPSFRKDLINLIQETELNSIIIDIKDFTGTISFDSDNPKLLGVDGPGCKVSDMKEFLKEIHDKGIYIIGRVTVFQDPYYSTLRPDLAVKRKSDGAVWEDYKGINFIEVGARDYWDYIMELARESYELGFDEINFDYIRFPSDGNMKDIYFPFSNDLIKENPKLGKAIALEEFFKYLKQEMDKTEIVTSADLFGMVTTNTDDLNIGQVLERALPYFDYIAPMVYPSHYPAHFNGWVDPNDYPYELIEFVMASGVERVKAFDSATSTPAEVTEHVHIKQLRPWIQDFDYGGNYDVAEVRAQIQATYDVGLDSWMIWAPSNRYTKGALEKK